MKILLSWLREFVPFTVDAQQLSSDLSMLGLAVDSVTTEGAETVLELDVTTNRPDCLSHYGVARELAARYELPLAAVSDDSHAAKARARRRDGIVEIQDAELCSRYSARIIREIEVRPSPIELAERLRLTGIRAINNVADATNYVLMSYGHPMHAFDLDRLEGGRIVVRRAQEGETLTTLDGVERKLNPDDLVIADARRPVALAGIMGGQETEISAQTRNVLLESAWFEPKSIRRTAKRHGLHTEASHRFERGADIGATVFAATRCIELIQQLAGGTIDPAALDAYPKPHAFPAVTLRRWELTRHLGMEIPEEEVEKILFRLGFTPRAKGRSGWTCHSPSFRVDVAREIDLVEEVARHFGYERIPQRLPAGSGQPAKRTAHADQDEKIQALLSGLGYDETVSLVLVGRETTAFSEQSPVALSNPLSEDAAVLRTSLLPRLLDAVQWNLNRGQGTVRLFEAGNIYYREAELHRETAAITLIATGDRWEPRVGYPPREFDFFDIKGDVEQFAEMFEGGSVAFDAQDLPTYYRAGHAARLLIDRVPAVFLGQLEPSKLEQWKLRKPVFAAELFLEQFRTLKLRQPQFKALSRFPAVERDFSILLPEGTTFEAVRTTVLSLGIAELIAVTPVEIFRGASLPPGQYSLLLRITLQSDQATLTEKELADYSAQIIQSLEQKLGARVRVGG